MDVIFEISYDRTAQAVAIFLKLLEQPASFGPNGFRLGAQKFKRRNAAGPCLLKNEFVRHRL